MDDEDYDELDSFIGNPTLTELAFCETSKGGLMMLEGNFSYSKHRVTGDVTQWHCVQRGYCKARLHTKGNEVIASKSIHSHECNSHIFLNSQAKAEMKRKASESQEATHSIMTASISELNEQSAVHLPKINSLKRTIVRSRRKAENVPPEPLSLHHLSIPQSYTKTKKDQQFLLYDSGAESGNQRIVIFGTQDNVELLSSATVWLADGTFKTVPSLFYQLYVIHALKGGPGLIFTGHIFPSLYILLPNKTQQTYSNMWNKVLDLCPTACPTHLIVDFEIASINAFSQYFLTTKVQGCFFHLYQNVWRKVQHFGLAGRYKQDVEAIQVRMLPALAFATPTDIPELFNNLFLQLPVEAYDLALYFEATYIGRHIANSPLLSSPLFPMEMWDNHFMVQHGLPRANNAVEAWHRSFACHMSCYHPSVWRFLTILKREQGLVEVKQAFFISGRNPSKRRYFEEREKALENLVESYLLRPKFEFLRGVSYHFTFHD